MTDHDIDASGPGRLDHFPPVTELLRQAIEGFLPPSNLLNDLFDRMERTA